MGSVLINGVEQARSGQTEKPPDDSNGLAAIHTLDLFKFIDEHGFEDPLSAAVVNELRRRPGSAIAALVEAYDRSRS